MQEIMFKTEEVFVELTQVFICLYPHSWTPTCTDMHGKSEEHSRDLENTLYLIPTRTDSALGFLPGPVP